jgi:hypothetical protein
MNARPHPDALSQERENRRLPAGDSGASVFRAEASVNGLAAETESNNLAKTFASRPHSSRAEVRAGGSTKLCFSLAARADDAEIRRLFRENPMAGRISVSLEREPYYFADSYLAEEKQTIVARKQGRVVCVGSCAIRRRFVNGQPCRIGYLGGLRLDTSVAGRFDILRRGYQFFRELQAGAPADFYFTGIAADNERARQFLERDLPGMPAYEFIGEFATLLLPVKRRSSTEPDSTAPWKCAGPETDAEQLVELHNHHAQQRQFSPCWAAGELSSLASLGLHTKDFLVVRRSDYRLAASAALWDQRGFKQAVIRGYAPWLARMRPLINLAARLTRQPGLPAIGSALAHATISHLAMEPAQAGELITLVNVSMARAAERQIEFLTLGFAADDPLLSSVRNHFKRREYRSRLYLVRWPELGGAAGDLDGRILQPELALL